jgi:hypothetical protein
MFAVYGRKAVDILMDTQLMRVFHQATRAIAAKGALQAIAVVINHAEIETLFSFQYHKPVCANSFLPVTKPADLLSGQRRGRLGITVEYDEVVSGTLVFVKCQFHIAVLAC